MPESHPEMGVSEGVARAVTVKPSRYALVRAGEDADEGMVHVWPHLVARELVAALFVVALLMVLALLFDAPLEERANPSLTPNPAKAAWYFLGLQELLVYFDPWFAGVLLPSLIVFGLHVLPYVDFNRGEGPGHGSEPRRLAVPFFTAGLILWFGLILIGQYFRGLSWQWYWPWENWHVPRRTEAFTWSLSTPVGAASVLGYLASWLVLPALLSPRFLRRAGWVRYLITWGLVAVAAAIPLKIAARLLFDIKYVLVTPWFNI